MMSTTNSETLARSFIEIQAGRHIAKCPGVAFWNRKKGSDDHGKLKIEGSIGPEAERILKTLMNDLKEKDEPVIEKITIHPEGVWIVVAKGIGMSSERVIGFAEGILAHATQSAS